MSDGPKSYELMYGDGGHGGPWYGLEAAIEGARRFLAGCKSETIVYVVPRDERPLDRRNAVRKVTRGGVS